MLEEAWQSDLLQFHVDLFSGVSLDMTGTQVFSPFHVDLRCGVSVDMSWQINGKQNVSNNTQGSKVKAQGRPLVPSNVLAHCNVEASGEDST